METTTELYYGLLMRAPRASVVPLIRAAAAHLATTGTGGPNERMLLRNLAGHNQTPGDILARFVDDTDPTIRQRVLLHPNLAPEVLAAAVRKERSPIVVAALARESSDAATLTALAGRSYRGKQAAQTWASLLDNTSLPVPVAADLLVRVQAALLAGAPDPDGVALDAAAAAFALFPGTADLVLGQLTVPRLALAAARRTPTPEQWDQLERVLFNPATTTQGKPAGHVLVAMRELLQTRSCPEGLGRRVAAVVFEHGDQRSADTARHYLAQLAASADAGIAGNDADAAALAAAASDDPQELLALVARTTLPPVVAWRIARNPAADVDTILTMLRRIELNQTRLVELMAAHEDPEVRARLAWDLGPDAVDAVPATDRQLVFELVMDTLLETYGGTPRFGATGVWMRFAETFDGTTLASLPWPLVRRLAGTFQAAAAWLLPQLTAALELPGAARVFAATEAQFSGTTSQLLAALAGACGEPGAA